MTTPIVPFSTTVPTGATGTLAIDGVGFAQTDDDKTEKLLRSATLAANAFGNNVVVRVKVAGGFANNANDKRVRLYIGTIGPIQLDQSIWDIVGKAWAIFLEITGDADAQVVQLLLVNGPGDFSANAKWFISLAPGALDTTVDTLIHVTGQNTVDTADDAINSAGDILVAPLIIEYITNPS